MKKLQIQASDGRKIRLVIMTHPFFIRNTLEKKCTLTNEHFIFLLETLHIKIRSLQLTIN